MITPTPEQQRIIELDHGQHLVLAPPGTGKTDLLSLRVARALDLGIAPEKMLCVTFTVRAADEMKKRIRQHGGKRRPPEVGNVHSLCHHFLYSRKLIPQRWRVIDEDTQADLMKEVLEEFPVASIDPLRTGFENVVPVHELMQLAATLRQLGLKFPTHIVRDPRRSDLYRRHRGLVRQIASRFFRLKEEFAVIDFDDLLTYTYHFLALRRSVRPEELYSWVQVDEAQDLNALQWAIIEKLSIPRVHAVYFGDLEQSIYAFMGASASNLDRLAANATLHNLPKNFRSKSYLLDLFIRYAIRNLKVRWQHLPIPGEVCAAPPGALQLIRAEPQGGQRPFEAEVEKVGQLLDERRQMGQLEKTAVLVHSNMMADRISAELTRRQLEHCKVSGFDLFSRVELRDFRALCAALTDPGDRLAWSRLFKLFARIPTQKKARHLVHALYQVGFQGPDLMCDLAFGILPDYLENFVRHVEGERVVVFDTETTGLKTDEDEIVQIAAVEVIEGVPGRTFEVYINTPRDLGDSVRIHRITREILEARGVTPFAGLQAFAEFVGESAIVAHNLPFDLAMLKAGLTRHEIAFDFAAISTFDTLNISRRLHPDQKSFTLGDLLTAFELEGANTHNALDDVRATVGLLLKLAADAAPSLESRGDLLRQFEKPIQQLRENLWPLWHRLTDDPAQHSTIRAEFEHFIEYCFVHSLYATGEFLSDRELPTARISGPQQSPGHVDLLPGRILQRADKFTRFTDRRYGTLFQQRPYLPALATVQRQLQRLSEVDVLLGDEKVVVSTIHKAKGLEFETVIIPRCVDNIFPNAMFATTDEQIRESARLLYVAMTRSRRNLILIHSVTLSPFLWRVVEVFRPAWQSRDSATEPRRDWLDRLRQLIDHWHRRISPPDLKECLASEDPDIQAHALRLLPYSQEAGKEELCRGALASSYEEVREEAVRIVPQIFGTGMFQLLAGRFDDPFEEVRLAIVETLNKQADAAVLPYLQKMFEGDHSARVRYHIVAGLGEYEAAAAEARALAELALRDPYAAIRLEAAAVLEQFGDASWSRLIQGNEEDWQHLGEE